MHAMASSSLVSEKLDRIKIGNEVRQCTFLGNLLKKEAGKKGPGLVEIVAHQKVDVKDFMTEYKRVDTPDWPSRNLIDFWICWMVNEPASAEALIIDGPIRR